MVVETISNPLLRVADLAALGRIAHERWSGAVGRQHPGRTGGLPAARVRRRLGHGKHDQDDERTQRRDVGIAVRTGRSLATRAGVLSTWGLTSAPFDCWLALARSGHAWACASSGLATTRWPWRSSWQSAKPVERFTIPDCRASGSRVGPAAIWRSLWFDRHVHARGRRSAAARSFMAASTRFPFARRWAN